MSWESRGGEAKYLTRTILQNGVRVREYYGRGPLAEIMAVEFAKERDRAGRSPRWRSIRDSLGDADRMYSRLTKGCEHLLRASLLAAGYHNHRGAWRSRSRRKFWTPQEVNVSPKSDLHILIAEAQEGNRLAVETLKALLNSPEPWHDTTTLCHEIEAAWLGFISRKEPEAVEPLTQDLDALRRQFSLSPPTSIDQLLVERVALTWMEARACEILIRPTNRVHVPLNIQRLLAKMGEGALKRCQRAKERLALARQRL
ncbi:MAG: hypothetical protein HYX68_04870 [Planctomycetes bacterium]|nr:hypothetical protein [Planctomycetota bacterium]